MSGQCPPGLLSGSVCRVRISVRTSDTRYVQGANIVVQNRRHMILQVAARELLENANEPANSRLGPARAGVDTDPVISHTTRGAVWFYTISSTNK